MKIFQAITNADIVPLFHEKTGQQLDVLISYPYLGGQASKLTKHYRDKIGSLYLDSGAYSVSRGKCKITLSEYCNYLKRYGNFFDGIFNLDDDFENPDHNLENQIYLEKGLSDKRLIPVIHDTENPFDEFKMYADAGYDYIAIGSNKRIKDEVFEKIKQDYPLVKIHMFGNLNREILSKHKPYSADATTWAVQAGYGYIYYWDNDEEDVEKKENVIYVGEKEKKGNGIIHFNTFDKDGRLSSYLWEKFKYSYSDLLTSNEAKFIVNLYFFKELENYINSTSDTPAH